MTSRQNRKAHRAAERSAQKAARKLERKSAAFPAIAARQDEAAVLSKPKIQQDEAAVLSKPKIQQDEAAVLSMANIQENEAGVLSEPQALLYPPSKEISPGRLAANRANAKLSTGPTSEAGKVKSSTNALKTALTGRIVLLPEDDADRYEQHLARYNKLYQPTGERECEIVQSLADTTSRIDRIPGLEEALYVIGCNEFAAEVTDLDPQARLTMLRMRTYLSYERQFRNLHIQEMRLHRLREKLVAELKQLQQDREQKEKDDLAIAAKLYIAAQNDRQPFDPASLGFEFSTEDVEAYLHGQRASLLADKTMSAGGTTRL